MFNVIIALIFSSYDCHLSFLSKEMTFQTKTLYKHSIANQKSNWGLATHSEVKCHFCSSAWNVISWGMGEAHGLSLQRVILEKLGPDPSWILQAAEKFPIHYSSVWWRSV